MSVFSGPSDFTGPSIFSTKKTDNDYCERCGRLGKCSQIYVCEFTTDINGQYLSYDTFEFKSDSSDEEESDSSGEEYSSGEEEEEEESDESESDEGPPNLEDILYVTCKKCWRYGHFAEECESTTHVLGHKLDVYI